MKKVTSYSHSSVKSSTHTTLQMKFRILLTIRSVLNLKIWKKWEKISDRGKHIEHFLKCTCLLKTEVYRRVLFKRLTLCIYTGIGADPYEFINAVIPSFNGSETGERKCCRASFDRSQNWTTWISRWCKATRTTEGMNSLTALHSRWQI